MADVKLSWGSGATGQTFTIEYKKTSNSTWIVAVTGISATTHTVTGLDTNTSYDFRVIAKCIGNCPSDPVTVTTTTSVTYIWIEDTFTCEQTDPLTIGDTYGGFSSPQGLYWDNSSGRFYVVDVDDIDGNLWYFNPATFTGISDRVYVTGSDLPGQFTQSHDYSPSLRKVFIANQGTTGVSSSGGVFVHRIASNTNNFISNGSNGSFARLFCKVIGDYLYVSNRFDNTLTLIDPVTETVIDTISVTSIPDNTGNIYFNNSYNILGVNGELWVCAGSYRGFNGNIARYNSDLSVFLGEIVIPSVTPPTTGGGWSGGYWQSQFFDKDKEKFYLCDTGSRLITIIDTSDNSIIEQIPVDNLQGKNYGTITWSLNNLTGELFATKTSMNNPSDPGITKFYVLDRDNYEYKSIYLNQSTSGLALREGTGEFWAASTGAVGWTPTPGWDTDGQIFKYNS